MPDLSISISYIVNHITDNTDGSATINYTMSHSGTELSLTRNDKFNLDDLNAGVDTSNMTDSEKLTQLQTNFESLAYNFFELFAKQIRTAQEQSDLNLLDGVSNTVNNLSVTMQGIVKIVLH